MLRQCLRFWKKLESSGKVTNNSKNALDKLEIEAYKPVLSVSDLIYVPILNKYYCPA